MLVALTDDLTPRELSQDHKLSLGFYSERFFFIITEVKATCFHTVTSQKNFKASAEIVSAYQLMYIYLKYMIASSQDSLLFSIRPHISNYSIPPWPIALIIHIFIFLCNLRTILLKHTTQTPSSSIR